MTHLRNSLKKLVFGALFIGSALSANATLLHLRSGYYIAAAGDIAWHNNIEFRAEEGFTKLHYDIGQGTSVSLGVLLRHWRLEVEGAYRKTNLDKITTQFLTEDATGFIKDFTLMINGYWDMRIPNCWWIVYVGSGLGVTFQDRKACGDVCVPGTDGNLGKASNTLFAWQGMAGVSYEIIEHAYISLGYRIWMSAKPRSSIVTAQDIAIIHNIELGARIEF